MKIAYRIRRLGLAALLLTGMGAAPNASAITELGLIIDGSGSISAAEFNVFRQGIANAVNTINTNSTVRVTSVLFGANAIVPAGLGPTLIDSAATRTAYANTISTLTRAGINTGATNYEAAFNAMVGQSIFGGTDLTLINMLTDGSPNQGNTASGRTNLINAGADLISYEGIGLTAGQTTTLQNLAYPNPPGVMAPPFPNPIESQGFVVSVASFTDVENALKSKFVAGGIAQVPEPGTLALLGIGLVGLAGLRRKRAA